MRHLVFFILLFIIPYLQAQTHTYILTNGKIEFLAQAQPGFLKIKGTGKIPQGQFSLNEKILSADFKIPVDSLETGFSKRDESMKQTYLQMKKFPYIHLRIQKYKLKKPWSLKKPKIKITLPALLELHGVKKLIHVQIQIDKDKKLLASFKIKVSDFKIDIPTFAGVTMTDEVNIHIESKITLKAKS